MLFPGVPYFITAFPNLYCVLTELKRLDSTVGTTVLSVGVGNDIVSRTLLALSVPLDCGLWPHSSVDFTPLHTFSANSDSFMFYELTRS